MLVSVWFPLVHDLVDEAFGDLHKMRIPKKRKRKKRRVNPRKNYLNPHHWVMSLCLLILFRVHRVLQVTTHPYGTKFWTIKLSCKGNWMLWTITNRKSIVANAKWSTNWTSTSFKPDFRWSLHQPLLPMTRGVLLILTLTLFLITLRTMHVSKCGGRDRILIISISILVVYY